MQAWHALGGSLSGLTSAATNRAVVDTRTFPVLTYDPRKGDKIAHHLSLQDNPSEKLDFFIEPKTNEIDDFIRFARTLPHGINKLETL